MKCIKCGYDPELVADSIPSLPSGPSVPRGLEAIKKTFGEPGKVPLKLVNVVVKGSPVGRVKFYAHELLAERFTWVFCEISRRGLGKYLLTFDGCYNPRLMRGSKTNWSTHSWAIACDTNASGNFNAPGTEGQNLISKVFAEAGFVQLRNDPMHNQYALGY